MKKLIIFVLAISLVVLPALCGDTATKESKKAKAKSVEIEYETPDKFLISATLTYPKAKAKLYPVIVLLHSIGSNSQNWGILPEKFTEAGFAVLNVDLRGHGKSIYNINLDKKYWQNMTLKAFAKYPNDIAGLMDFVKEEHKNISVANYAVIGADIGANTAILASQKMKTKPFALVLISPVTTFKGLYVPVALADLTTTNVLFVYSQQDVKIVNEVKSLKRFVQGKVNDITSPSGGTGMILVKTSPQTAVGVVNWCVDEFNGYFGQTTPTAPSLKK